jgi:hypothetical protein
MAQSLKKKIERLEQQAAAWARERDEELYGSRPDEEILFFIAHGYFPEAAIVCSGAQRLTIGTAPASSFQKSVKIYVLTVCSNWSEIPWAIVNWVHRSSTVIYSHLP